MNEEIKNDEIISELLHISTLYSSQQSLSRKLALLSGEQSREKERLFDRTEENLRAFQKDQLNSFSATKPSIPSACISMPPPPPPKMEHPEKTEKKILIGSLLGLGLLAVFPIMFIAVALESAEILPKLAEFLNSIYVLMGAGCFVGWCLYGHFAITEVVEWEKKQTAWEATLADWEDAFNKNCSVSENERFLAKCKEYDDRFHAMIEACTEEYSKEQKRTKAAQSRSTTKFKKKRSELEAELSDVQKELYKSKAIHSEYFHLADNIAYLLLKGRADTLKEALNLALDEERRDKEEAERKAEAERQEELLKKQAAEERRHNAEMQRIAEEEARNTRMHNAAMARAAEEQAKAARNLARQAEMQAREQERQERNERKAASAKCTSCANFSKCSYAVRQNSLTCSAYTPR